jgi:hypothetical protein
VRGVVYFLAILAGALIAGRMPVLGVVAGALPWYLRDLALPGAIAVVMTVIRIEGRPFHLAARVLVRYRTRPRRLAGLCAYGPRSCFLPGGRWRPEEILMLPDGSDSRMRRLRYTGPGAVLIASAHEREATPGGVLGLPGRRGQLIVRQRPGERPPARGQVIVLERAARLRVR